MATNFFIDEITFGKRGILSAGYCVLEILSGEDVGGRGEWTEPSSKRLEGISCCMKLDET